jgi:hypothetical protein
LDFELDLGGVDLGQKRAPKGLDRQRPSGLRVADELLRDPSLKLDPAYVDTVVRRWQALTGGSARHAVNGRSFDDLAREAEVADAA